MDHFPKPPNKTNEELRHVAAILTMIATAITRMADATPDASHTDRQNKKTVGESTPAPNGLPEHEILTVADVAKYQQPNSTSYTGMAMKSRTPPCVFITRSASNFCIKQSAPIEYKLKP